MNLYYLPPSPPCRAVLMLGRILQIDLNLKSVNIQEKEHLKKDFLEVRLRSKKVASKACLPCYCIINLLNSDEQHTSSRVLIRALVLLTKLFDLILQLTYLKFIAESDPHNTDTRGKTTEPIFFVVSDDLCLPQITESGLALWESK